MRFLFRSACLCLAALLVSTSFFACKHEAVASSDTTAPVTADAPVTTEAPEPTISIIADGASAFVIVRAETSSDSITAAAIDLRKQLDSKFGSSMSISTDWVKNEADIPIDTCEIIVGTSNRPESKAALSELTDGQFIIKAASDKRIVILGYSDDATVAAVNAFLSLYVEGCDSKTLSLPLDTSLIGEVFDNFAEVRPLSTDLIAAPSIVCRTDSSSALDAIKTSSPATAMFRFHDGRITADDGTMLASFSDAMKQLDGKTIPAFSVETQADANELIKLIKAYSLKDFFVISSDANIVASVIDANNQARGIIDYTSMTEHELNDKDLYAIRAEVNTANAHIALLPAWMANAETIQYLQKLLITVWVDTEADATVTDLVQAVTSGATGIAVRAHHLAELERCMGDYFAPNTFVRPVYIIGHRGIPSMAPENTIEGSLLAYEKGADIIENDVYLSKDGEVVVMHDSTIDRTTNGTGKIESMTLEQIKTFLVNKTNAAKYPNAQIPTLREYFETFKDTDAQIFIEIKSSNPAIIPKISELIREYDIADQVSVIAFSTEMMEAIKKECPELSVGYLVSNYTDPADTYGSLAKVNQLVGQYHTTFNQNHTNLTPEFITEAGHRGITLWPWTLNDGALFSKFFMLGINGLTTNYTSYVTNSVRTLTADQYNYNVSVGSVVSPTLTAFTYGRNENGHIAAEIDPAKLEIVFLEGKELAKVDGATVTPTSPGKISFIYSYSAKTMLRDEYHVVTQPITITVDR